MEPFDPIEAMAAARHEFGEHGGVNLSVEASSTFTFLRPETMPSLFRGRRGPKEGCYLYARHFNPTVWALGRQLAAMEAVEAAYCTASGMAAISATLLQLCGAGDHIVAGNALYGGTFALLRDYLPARTGIRTTFVSPVDLAAVERAFTERTKVLFVETMSNPTMVVPDLRRLADLAHAHGARLVVDNTFAPLVVTPARHGADVVVHSLTKFVNGASDLVAGAVCGSESFLLSLMDLHHGGLMLLGPTMDPMQAFHVSLRLPHLGLRMKEHGRRALLFAGRLRDLGVPVIHAGLETHPSHGTLVRQANPGFGLGGMLAIDLGTVERANRFMSVLQNKDTFGYIAVSLGYFDTLVSSPASSTSSELSEEERETAAISPGLVRMSIGYTGSAEQRWDQLEDALRSVGILASLAGAAQE
jgi:methionine-gamma-lyase